MRVPDKDILRQIDLRFPIRARLVTRHNGDKVRFELTDVNGIEVLIAGVSALRILALLRLHNYTEVIEEIVAFDCELVFSKPVGRPAKSTKRPYHPMDDHPRIRQFI
jgi:hypothetical protein